MRSLVLMALLFLSGLPAEAGRAFTNTSSGLRVKNWSGFTTNHTLSLWVQLRMPDPGSTSFLLALIGSPSTYLPAVYLAREGTGRKVRFAYEWSGGSIYPSVTNVIPTNVWTHLCMSRTAQNAVVCYVDGIPLATNNSSWGGGSSVAAITNVVIASAGFLGQSANAAAAEVAIWTEGLSPGEVSALAAGITPLRVRPQSLSFYAPILGVGLPETEFINAWNFTTNTAYLPPVADHPRIYR